MASSPEPRCEIDDGAATRVPAQRPDFQRRLVCILGLPFDAITLAEAVQRVREDAFSNRRCFVSTPNLNFAMAAQTDPEFRGSVLRSDLSLVDGMPLVWIARLLGVPVPMRVAGSALFEALVEHPAPVLSVYFFGGPSGAAAAASERVNRRAGGVHCVGFDSPGIGSVESLSTVEHIERINRSGAQFVVVALGAKKGQAWIERNAGRLVAPVVSHLGAVVNFAAGALRRAPTWMQQSGLEWLWRIKEEPQLWRRYWNDGRGVLRIAATRVLPDAITRRSDATSAGVTPIASPGQTTLRLHGAWIDTRGLESFAGHLADCAKCETAVIVDLREVTEVGNRLAALLLVACGWFGRHGGFRVVGAKGKVARSLYRKAVILDC